MGPLQAGSSRGRPYGKVQGFPQGFRPCCPFHGSRQGVRSRVTFSGNSSRRTQPVIHQVGPFQRAPYRGSPAAWPIHGVPFRSPPPAGIVHRVPSMSSPPGGPLQFVLQGGPLPLFPSRRAPPGDRSSSPNPSVPSMGFTPLGPHFYSSPGFRTSGPRQGVQFRVFPPGGRTQGVPSRWSPQRGPLQWATTSVSPPGILPRECPSACPIQEAEPGCPYSVFLLLGPPAGPVQEVTKMGSPQ
jgi:hypothetical protein